MPASAPIRLNLGCGLLTSSNWTNVDASWNARLAKYPRLRRSLAMLRLLPREKAEIPWSPSVVIHDLRKPLPFLTGTVSAVYASHVLEHLYREEAEQLVAECRRVLISGGVLRIVVPDLRAIVEKYLSEGGSNGNGGIPAADLLNERLLMRWPSPARSSFLHRLYAAGKDLHSHKWMYDAASLKALLNRSGFAEVETRNSFDSRIAGIREVEDASRIEAGAGVCAEGVKP